MHLRLKFKRICPGSSPKLPNCHFARKRLKCRFLIGKMINFQCKNLWSLVNSGSKEYYQTNLIPVKIFKLNYHRIVQNPTGCVSIHFSISENLRITEISPPTSDIKNKRKTKSFWIFWLKQKQTYNLLGFWILNVEIKIKCRT